MTIAWVDAPAGVAGDMLLGALADLGALDGLPAVVGSLGMGASVTIEAVTRHGLRAMSVRVDAPGGQPLRHLADVRALLESAAVPPGVRDRAVATFERLARAEARVHGTATEDVHFHEVGAVDAVVDVLGVCLGLDAIGVDDLTVSPVALGGGSATTAHGTIPIPGPAVLELMAGTALTGHGTADGVELATPTGVALLAEFATATGPMPPMTVTATGYGAGTRDLPGRANVVRIVTGTPVPSRPSDPVDSGEWRVFEANVDDLDPRLWPGVIDAMLAAGAVDAWVSPILMKKGRPAHTLHVLGGPEYADAIRDAVFTETSTIGLRETPVAKLALDREWHDATAAGQPVRIKLARRAGRIVTATPEWVDVAAAALATGRSERELLELARAEAARILAAGAAGSDGVDEAQ